MCLIACGDALAKTLTQTYSITQVLWVRTWPLLLLALALSGRGGVLGLVLALRSRRPGLQVGRALLLASEMAVFMLAFRSLPLAEVTAVAATAPLVVTALAVPLLGERVGPHRWAAVAVGFLGVLLVVRPGGGFGAAMLLPVAGVLMWGLYQVLLRLVSRQDSHQTTLAYTAVVVFLALGLLAPLSWRAPSPTDWLWLLALGLIHGLGHYALIRALAGADASLLQPFNYTQIVWAMGLGLIFFGQFPDAWALAGTAMIVAGGLYALARERRRGV